MLHCFSYFARTAGLLGSNCTGDRLNEADDSDYPQLTTTPETTTPETTTPEATTPEPSTPEPATPEPTTPEPTIPETTIPEPATPEPAITPEQMIVTPVSLMNYGIRISS